MLHCLRAVPSAVSIASPWKQSSTATRSLLDMRRHQARWEGPSPRAVRHESRFQWEALRELRDLGGTSLVAHQRYALRACLSRLTQLSFVREVHPEQSPGKLLVGHSVTRAEARTQVGKLDVTGSLSWDRDHLAGVSTELVGFGVTGNLDSLNHLQVSYSGRTGRPDPAIPDHLVKLAFERKPDEFLKLALSAEWRAWGDRRADELLWQLDLAAVF